MILSRSRAPKCLSHQVHDLLKIHLTLIPVCELFTFIDIRTSAVSNKLDKHKNFHAEEKIDFLISFLIDTLLDKFVYGITSTTPYIHNSISSHQILLQ